MSFAACFIIAYASINLLLTIGNVGTSFTITPATAVLTAITHATLIICAIALATS